MYRLLVCVLCFGWSLLAHAGLFGPDFEITKTVPPKNGEDSVLYLSANGLLPTRNTLSSVAVWSLAHPDQVLVLVIT